MRFYLMAVNKNLIPIFHWKLFHPFEYISMFFFLICGFKKILQALEQLPMF